MNNSPFTDLLNLIEGFVPQVEQKKDGTGFEKLFTSQMVTEEFVRNWYSVSSKDGHRYSERSSGKLPAIEAHLCLLASSYAQAGPTEKIQEFIEKAGKGGCAVNQYCVKSGLGLRILELAPGVPHVLTPSAPAWGERETVAATAFGMEAAAVGADILALEGVAEGTHLASMAVMARVMQLSVSELQTAVNVETGCSETGETKDLYSQLQSLLDQSEVTAPLDVMRAFGGREIAGLVGAVTACRSQAIPVVVSGWSALAAVALLQAINPLVIDHVLLASVESAEQAFFARKLGLSPLIGLNGIKEAGVANALALDLLTSLLGNTSA